MSPDARRAQLTAAAIAVFARRGLSGARPVDVAEAVDVHRDYVRVWLDWSTAVRGALWTRYVAVQDRILAVVIPTIRRGQRAGDLRGAVDPEHLARLFIGAGYMVTLMRLSDESPAYVMEFAETVVRVSRGEVLRSFLGSFLRS